MNLQLQNKLIVVTASTGGIGFYIAAEAFRNGAFVIVNGRSQESIDKAIQEIFSENGGTKESLVGIPADLSSGEGVEAFIKKIKETENKLKTQVYGLVNNLGFFDPKPFQKTTDEDWEQYHQINLMSGVRLSRHFLPKMLERDEGRILFVSSESGLKPLPHMLAYSVSKTAQISLARGMAEITKGTNVTVNSILPGPTKTESVAQFMKGMADQKNQTFEEYEKSFFKETEPTSLLQRLLDPKEVANVTVFTLSPLASGVNGAAQHVNGGIVRHI